MFSFGAYRVYRDLGFCRCGLKGWIGIEMRKGVKCRVSKVRRGSEELGLVWVWFRGLGSWDGW